MATPCVVTAPERRSVSDTYWGETVEDAFQYLENTEDEVQKQWTRESAEQALAYLKGLPMHDHFSRELERIVGFESPIYFDIRLHRESADPIFFAQKRLPPNPQPVVVSFASVDGSPVMDRVLFDPKEADGTPAVDMFEPSPCGTFVALSLSYGGSERGDAVVIRADSGERLPDVVKRVHTPTAGGSFAWNGADGFYYTRHPLEGEVGKEDLDFFQKIYYHKLGTAADADVACLGETFPRIAECLLLASPDGRHLHCACADGDGGEYAVYVSSGSGAPCRESEGQWRYISGFKDGIKHQAQWSTDGSTLFMLSNAGAPKGQIVRLDAGALAESPPNVTGDPHLQLISVAVKEMPDAVIQDFAVTQSRLYVNCMVGGPSKIFVFDSTTGSPLVTFPSPEGQRIFGLIPLPSTGDDIYFSSMGYTAPRALQRFRAADNSVSRTAVAQASPVDFSDCEATVEYCSSKDGTRVPLTILQKKDRGAAGGPAPCVLYAYGGYGISLTPAFSASFKPWLDLGGRYVVANIRGGGEYGEDWHLNGNLTKKQNVFDDFLAAAEHLISAEMTTRELLVAEGGSNGGLLVGAALTQRPDLFRTVVAHVGIFDSLRTELEPNGVFNIPEFGTVTDEAHYRALRAYSPYHNVSALSEAPAIPDLLLTTGENDGRVASWQSKKFAAALAPVYARNAQRHLVLRVDFESGHGMGTPLQKTVESMADAWAFKAESTQISSWRASRM